MSSSRLYCIFFGAVAILSLSFAQAQTDLTASEVFKKCQSSVVRIETDESLGTGFFVKDGRTIATCLHVLSGAKTAKIGTSDGKVYTIDSVQFDEPNDIAIVTISEITRTKPVQLSLNSQPEIGTPIHVIGNPLGFLERTLSSGSVSALRNESGKSLIQISAPISPGSSGSPVLNSEASAIGMVTASQEEGQLLNFAVPSSAIKQALLIEPIAWSVFTEKFKKAATPSKIATIDLTDVFNPTFNSLNRMKLMESSALQRLSDSAFQSVNAAASLIEKSADINSLLEQSVGKAREMTLQTGCPTWCRPYYERLSAISNIAKETYELQTQALMGFQTRSKDLAETVKAWMDSRKRQSQAEREWKTWVWEHLEFKWIRFVEESDPPAFYFSTARAIVGAYPDPAFKFETRIFFTDEASKFQAGDVIKAIRFTPESEFSEVTNWKELKLLMLVLPETSNGLTCRLKVLRNHDLIEIESVIKW